MQMKRIVLLFLFMLFSIKAFATTYYVDSAVGADTNSGKAITVPFLTIQHAEGISVAGDTIYILPGKGYCQGYSSGTCIDITRSGSAGGGYITYSGYPGMPRPILNGQQGFAVITLETPVSYINIQNLEISGWNGDLTLAGAWTNASTPASWFNNLVYDSYGIWTGQSNDATLTTNAVTLSGSTLHFASTPTSAIIGCIVADTFSGHTGAIAAGTTITAAPANSLTLSQAVSSEVFSADTIQVNCPVHHVNITNNVVHDFPCGGIYTSTGDYLTISGNIIYNNSWYSPLGCSGLQVYASRDVDTSTANKIFVTGNVAYNNFELIPSLFVTDTGYTTSATTSTSSAILHFNGTTQKPATGGVHDLWYVLDTTTPSAIVPGTFVTGTVTDTAVTMSNNAAATVGLGDNIVFSYTSDGEGLSNDDNSNDQTGGNAYIGGTVYSNNLAFNNGSEGVASYDSVHVTMSFNTAYQNLTTAFLAANGGGEITNQLDKFSIVANNIAYASGTTNTRFADGSTSNTFLGNNLCFGGSVSQTCPGSGNVTTNPNFVNPSIVAPFYYQPYAINGAPPLSQFLVGFQLQPGSPAIDAGTASYTRSTDILGNPGLVGPSYDMGAFESPCSTYSTGGTTTATVSSPSNLNTTQLQNGQAPGSITPTTMRNLVATLSCGRSPYLH